MAPSKSAIAQCVAIAENTANELNKMLEERPSKKSRYDKQTSLQIRYAIRWCRKVARKIRSLELAAPLSALPGIDTDPRQAIELIKELRPVIAGSRKGAWRREILARMDEAIKKAAEISED